MRCNSEHKRQHVRIIITYLALHGDVKRYCGLWPIEMKPILTCEGVHATRYCIDPLRVHYQFQTLYNIIDVAVSLKYTHVVYTKIILNPLASKQCIYSKHKTCLHVHVDMYMQTFVLFWVQ